MQNKKPSQNGTVWKQIYKCIAILSNCKQFSLEYAECTQFEMYMTWSSIHDLEVIQD